MWPWKVNYTQGKMFLLFCFLSHFFPIKAINYHSKKKKQQQQQQQQQQHHHHQKTHMENLISLADKLPRTIGDQKKHMSCIG